MKIRFANACYTGGGIYVVWGTTEEGHHFFLGHDDAMWLDVDIETLDEKTWGEDLWTWEWMDEHLDKNLGEDGFADDDTYVDLWVLSADWIDENQPSTKNSNYSNYELKRFAEYIKG